MVDNNTKTGISPSTLGRERARYNEMKALGDVTKKQILAQMKIDAKRYAKKLDKVISFEDYKEDIETLPKTSGGGKREADKVTRDTLIIETQELNAVNNLAILSHRGEVTLSDSDKITAFDALGERAHTLAHSMNTAFDGVKALTMLHAPEDLLCVHIAGWEDGSKNLRFQYAPRKVPITKRSGYRDDSFEAPVYDLTPEIAKPPVVESEATVPTPDPTPDTPEVTAVAPKKRNRNKGKSHK